MSESAPRATVGYGRGRHVATAAEPVTFGRDPGCTICLDPEDKGISRRAGRCAGRAGSGGW